MVSMHTTNSSSSYNNNNNNNKRDKKKLWEVTNMSMALIMVMVSWG